MLSRNSMFRSCKRIIKIYELFFLFRRKFYSFIYGMKSRSTLSRKENQSSVKYYLWHRMRTRKLNISTLIFHITKTRFHRHIKNGPN